MSRGNPFILRSEGQGHETEKNIADMGFYTLVSAGFFLVVHAAEAAVKMC